MASQACDSSRGLTTAEVAMAQEVFGSALDTSVVRIFRKRWWPLQPRRVVMAPRGHIYFHPQAPFYRDCLATGTAGQQGLLVHELVHVWQYQQGINLILRRLPFSRYSYSIVPGWPLTRYGLEQQAEIVRHAFLLRRGHAVAGAPPLATYEGILPFTTV